jgi:CII-binding regulator of phage lambda lysogenization HflD
MIAQIYLDRAVKIRREYLSLNKDASDYKVLVENLKNKVEETIDGLEDLLKNINLSTEDETKEKSLKYLLELEEESQKIQKVIDPINQRIQELGKEEQSLYEQIKLNYIDLTNEEILSIIQNEIKKQNLS